MCHCLAISKVSDAVSEGFSKKQHTIIIWWMLFLCLNIKMIVWGKFPFHDMFSIFPDGCFFSFDFCCKTGSSPFVTHPSIPPCAVRKLKGFFYENTCSNSGGPWHRKFKLYSWMKGKDVLSKLHLQTMSKGMMHC